LRAAFRHGIHADGIALPHHAVELLGHFGAGRDVDPRGSLSDSSQAQSQSRGRTQQAAQKSLLQSRCEVQ